MTEEYIRNLRIGINYDIKKLETALKYNDEYKKKVNRTDPLKEEELDVDLFLENLKRKDEAKKRRLQELEEKKNTTFERLFKPEINIKSRELAKFKPRHSIKVTQHIEKAKETARNLSKSKSDVSLNLRNHSKSAKNISKREIEKAEVFYAKNLYWQKKRDNEVLYNKIKKHEEMINSEKNLKMKKYSPKIQVNTTFSDRLKHYTPEKELKLKKIEEEMYNHSFKPKLFERK